MDRLLTQQDLADRWQVSVRAIENWRREGVITPAKGIPAIRFTPEHVAQLEGVELKPVSPLQVKRLERELEAVRAERDELRGILARVLATAAEVIPERKEGQAWGGGSS